MNDPQELLRVIDNVIGALLRQRIPYFVTGSFASSVHGEFRATNDIDIVAELTPPSLSGLFADLGAAFVGDIDAAMQSLPHGQSFNLIHTTTFLKVDVFPCTSEFNRSAIARAITVDIPGTTRPITVSSIEDIILAKLHGYRLGGEVSQVQQRDVQRLIELNRDAVDNDFLEHWALQSRVPDLLSKALAA
jgi:hypothetical protein